MGRCEEQQAPLNDNEVSDPIDYDEIVLNAVQEVHHGLDAIEQIVAMLPDGFEIFINFEEVDDMDQEGLVMLLPYEENYAEDDLYPEDTESARRMQLKSALVNDDYQPDYDWPFEESNSALDYDFSNDEEPGLLSDAEEVFRGMSQFPLGPEQFRMDPEQFRLSRELYYGDPLAQEEIDYEIVELGQMMRDELFGGSLENNRMEMGDEDYMEYCNKLEE